MQNLAETNAAAAANCTNLTNANPSEISEESLLNQFNENKLEIAIAEDAGHTNDLSGALSFLPPRQKDTSASAENILAYNEAYDQTMFRYDDTMHTHAIYQVQQQIEEFNNPENPTKGDDISYHRQVLIVWLLAGLLPIYLGLLLTGAIYFYSVATLCFTGAYLMLIMLLVALNIERR